MARDALRAVLEAAPARVAPDEDPTSLDPGPGPVGLPLAGDARRRLVGRHGPAATDLALAAGPGELEPVPGTRTLWAELRWAARAEAVVRLEDLMLRRTRLGLLLPGGGAAVLGRVREVCRADLGWTEASWDAEVRAYLDLWARAHRPPDPGDVPAWRPAVAAAIARRAQAARGRRRAAAAAAALGTVALAAARVRGRR